MSSALMSSSYSLTATLSVPTGTSSGDENLGEGEGGVLPANWIVLFVIGAILVPFLLILSGIACVSVRKSIRRARVKKLKSSIGGDGDGDVEGGGEVVPGAKTTGRAASATGSPERKSSPGAQSSVPSYAVIGEPLRTGLELRRGSLETVDIAGGGQERWTESPPAYCTTPAGTPSGRAL